MQDLKKRMKDLFKNWDGTITPSPKECGDLAKDAFKEFLEEKKRSNLTPSCDEVLPPKIKEPRQRTAFNDYVAENMSYYVNTMGLNPREAMAKLGEKWETEKNTYIPKNARLEEGLNPQETMARTNKEWKSTSLKFTSSSFQGTRY